MVAGARAADVVAAAAAHAARCSSATRRGCSARRSARCRASAPSSWERSAAGSRTRARESASPAGNRAAARACTVRWVAWTAFPGDDACTSAAKRFLRRMVDSATRVGASDAGVW